LHFSTILQDWSPQFLVYGDMGRIGGAPSLPRLISEARSGHNTAVLHVGDFAYDLNTLGGLVSKATMIFHDHALVWHDEKNINLI